MKLLAKVPIKFRNIWGSFNPAEARIKGIYPFPGKAKLRCSICDLSKIKYPCPAVYEGKISSQTVELAMGTSICTVLTVFDRKNVVFVQYFRRRGYAEFLGNANLYKKYFNPGANIAMYTHVQGLFKRPNAIRG